MPIDYDGAKKILEAIFNSLEANMLHGIVPKVDEKVRDACDVIYKSYTQAYREVLLGCAIARIQDKNINIRQPYVDQGTKAFSGRTLDERVINPFLQAHRIPCSRGPYLSVFRRSVKFETTTRAGLRDKVGYDNFLSNIAYLESVSDNLQLKEFIDYLAYKFLELREETLIPLMRLQRISLEQYDALITGLLAYPSGGRMPVLLVVATFTMIKEFFNLDWNIVWQGINVADIASGAGGDITITSRGQIFMAAEVTERPLDKSRVVTTFNTKIAPTGIEDYLFFVKSAALAEEARQQAHQYFAQGHEINFLEIKNWILMSLATTGKRGRGIFNKVLVDLVDAPGIPKTLKVNWNELIGQIVAGQN